MIKYLTLPGRLMVGQMPLKHLILVRIQARQLFDLPFVTLMARSQSTTIRQKNTLLKQASRISRVSEANRGTIQMKYFVYILRTSSNTLYIGQTNNLEKRIKEHRNKSSKSAKYIRYFSSFTLVYSEKYSTRKEAMQREAQLKRWSKAKKEALIRGDLELLKKL